MEFPTEMPVTLRDRLDLAQFVAYLRRASRRQPVVALTVAKGQAAPYLSAEELARAAGGLADIVTIPTDDLTWAFSESMNQYGAVYGGACRVYPTGQAWERHPQLAPIRMARTDDELANLRRLVLDDLKRAVEVATIRAVRPRPAPIRQVTAGVQATPGPTPLRGIESATVDTEADAAALRDYLFNPRRQRPVVVVTRAAGASQATADIERLRDQLTGLADIVEITTLQASWAFADAVPPMCQVYGGAGRVYSVGQDWSGDPSRCPLRLAYGLQSRDELTRQLVSDTMRLVSRGSYATAAAPARARVVGGEVIGVAGGRGIVSLEGGRQAALWPELIEPDVPGERLFAKGMKVTGQFDPESRRIDVRAMRRDPAEVVEFYHPGQTILVRVVDVARQSCGVELLPGVRVEIPASDIADEPEADLRDLMSPGETVAALLVGHEDGEWLLSPADADDPSQATPALSILRGGPPWLTAAEPEPAAPPAAGSDGGDETDGTADTAGGDDTDMARELRRENEQLAVLLKQAKQREADLINQLAMAKTRRREGQRRSRADRAADDTRQAEADLCLFADEAEQLDFEINLAWARKIPPGDKARWPLKPWRYGSRFFPTLRDLQGASRDKIVDVIVDALTGRDAELPSRDLHMLRTGTGGDDRPRTRDGGEVCWRSAIQINTPQARRLHYWKCNDGTIELASVRQHDDFDT